MITFHASRDGISGRQLPVIMVLLPQVACGAGQRWCSSQRDVPPPPPPLQSWPQQPPEAPLPDHLGHVPERCKPKLVHFSSSRLFREKELIKWTKGRADAQLREELPWAIKIRIGKASFFPSFLVSERVITPMRDPK